MDKKETKSKEKKSKPRIRFRRIFVTLGVLTLLVAVGYGASLYNSSRYFLIVEATQVRVAKGRMLPYGREAFVPRDPKLRPAYRTVPLPSGMQLPRGASSFTDRVQLDQALYRLIKDAAEYNLTKDDARTPELTTRYLAQIDALPGLNTQQQMSVLKLRRDAGYIEARGHLSQARQLLQKAEAQFRASAKGGGGRYGDGLQKSAAIRRALQWLDQVDAQQPMKSQPTDRATDPTTAPTDPSGQPSTRPAGQGASSTTNKAEDGAVPTTTAPPAPTGMTPQAVPKTVPSEGASPSNLPPGTTSETGNIESHAPSSTVAVTAEVMPSAQATLTATTDSSGP